MATVRSAYWAGKSVNVPHAEYFDAEFQVGEDEDGEPVFEGAFVQFDDDGFAEVSPTKAAALVQLHPRHVVVVSEEEE